MKIVAYFIIWMGEIGTRSTLTKASLGSSSDRARKA